jgi:hypothetical protein
MFKKIVSIGRVRQESNEGESIARSIRSFLEEMERGTRTSGVYNFLAMASLLRNLLQTMTSRRCGRRNVAIAIALPIESLNDDVIRGSEKRYHHKIDDFPSIPPLLVVGGGGLLQASYGTRGASN